MQEIKDFLMPDLSQIRHGIKDIDDSYNNDWDIIAELCQNAVDAIRKSEIEEGEIVLRIDAPNRSIYIYDNGIGIDPDAIPNLLKPFSTDKSEDDETIGEKGVGLTFVMFSCNDFRIKSGNGNGAGYGEVIDAHNWKNRRDQTPLILDFKKIDEDFKGTEIMLNKVENYQIFKLTFDQIKFILRTKTALGSTNWIWSSDKEIKINLYFRDPDGKEHFQELPSEYWLIYEDLPENAKIDLDEFIEYAKSVDRTDLEKRKKLRDKIIYKKGSFKHTDNRTIKYITCFVPKRRVWDDLSIQFRLCTEKLLENEQWLDNFGYARFQSGIYTSVKGMPTGISIDHPITGYAGYWSNIFVLFDDRYLSFDIGRKSIHGMQARIYKEYARKLFNEYLRYVTKYVSGEVKKDTEWDRDEIFANIEKMIDLDIPDIKLQKNPKDQEASIAALFFECIGNGKIREITPLTSGYRNKYDLYAKWGNRKVVIEFKSKLRNILKDFHDEQKMFNEINCIVCWNVDDDDKQAMKNRGIALEKITPSYFTTDEQNFPHSTHQLILSGFVSPIYVLDLRMIVS